MEHINPELLDKYFDGHCTPEEKALVEQWFSSENHEPYDPSVLKEVDKSALRDQLWKEVCPAPATRKAPAIRLNVLRIAALVALFLLCSLLVYQYQDILWTSPSTAYKTIWAEPGQKVKVALSDGTIVHLNGGSRLDVPEVFSDKDRTVYLQGEAHWQVSKDPARPFSVVINDMTVCVLGTIFNVKAYDNDPVRHVTVKEGKVSVTDSTGQQVILTQGQMAVWFQNDHRLRKQQAEIDDLMAWTEGKLVFKDQSLDEIAVILQRWYNVEISIANEQLKDHHFTGTFSHSPSLSSVIRDMALTMRFQYEFNENKLTLY